MNKTNEQSGFALLMTLIVVSIILAIGLTILDISTKTLALSTSAAQSEIAFHAANAGLECIRFWKDHEDEGDDFESGAVANVDCFGDSDSSPDTSQVANVGTGGNVYTYEFELDYGNPVRCSSAFVAVLVSEDDSNLARIDPPATNYFPWNKGPKECPAYSVCTAAFVRGYNTTCQNVQTSAGRFLQREILLEF